jgi:hypothetical protein
LAGRNVNSRLWRKHIGQSGLQSPLWLLVYELHRKEWLGFKKAGVDSSDERNAVCKLSGWRHEAKRFPRPGVKSERNGIQIGLAVGG